MAMASLSERDLRAILGFLQDLYRLQSFEDFARTLLRGLDEIVPADSSNCMECGPVPGNQQIFFSVPELAQYAKLYPVWERVCNDHPGWERLLREGAKTWYSISDFLSERAYRETALYAELYRYMDIEENLGTLYTVSPQRVLAISLNRDRRSFTDRDRAVLQLLHPHLVQSWRNAKLTGQLCAPIRAQEESADTRKEGIIILDAVFKLRFMSVQARRQLGKYFGRLPADDRLPERLEAWIRHQQEGLMTAPQEPLRMQAEDGSELRIALVRDWEAIALILQEQVAIRDLWTLGLTRRESDVLLLVIRGKSNQQIGAILNMSLGTVKKHLEHIFAKLGVESRTAAAMMALDKLGEPTQGREALLQKMDSD